jgi:glucan biosynthesis protein C
MDKNTRAVERRYDLDWIRIIAVLLLIPFHSARIFNIGEPFYVKNAQLSVILSLLVNFLGMWQMQLLFLIAGASTWYALGHRSGGQYVTERLKRLMVPFIFGTLVVVPPQMYIALLARGVAPESYLTFYQAFFQIRPADMPDYTGVGFTWAHLWFILDLFVISLIALPLFLALRTPRGRGLLARSADFLARGPAIFLLALPLPFVTFLLPEIDKKPFFVYLLVFVYGFALMADPRYREALIRNRRPGLILALICLVAIFGTRLAGIQYPRFSPTDVLMFFVSCFNLWFWLVAILGFGLRYLNATNRWYGYARDGAYPFYILHQTVIVAIGYFVVQWSAGPLAKWVVIMACSLALTIAIYDVCVRRTNVTRFLFGMKSLPRPAARPTARPVGQASQ